MNKFDYRFDTFFKQELSKYGYRTPNAKNPSTFTTNLCKQIEKLGLEVEIIRVV